MIPESVKRRRDPVACRVAEMADLLEVASIFDGVRYGPLDGSPGFESLGPLLPEHAERIIRAKQQAGELPGDEWRPALKKARNAAERWLFGDNHKAWPALRILAMEVAMQRRSGRKALAPERAQSLGNAVAELVFSGHDPFHAMNKVLEAWHGFTSNKARALNKRDKTRYLDMTAKAFALWRELRRNPTRKELFDKCTWPTYKRKSKADDGEASTAELNSDANQHLRLVLNNAGLGFLK